MWPMAALHGGEAAKSVSFGEHREAPVAALVLGSVSSDAWVTRCQNPAEGSSFRNSSSSGPGRRKALQEVLVSLMSLHSTLALALM